MNKTNKPHVCVYCGSRCGPDIFLRKEHRPRTARFYFCSEEHRRLWKDSGDEGPQSLKELFRF